MYLNIGFVKEHFRCGFIMISAQAGGVTAAKAMKKAALPWCRQKCGRKTKSMRAKLCLICFQNQAAETAARTAGNQKKGRVKKLAGKRSGEKRAAKWVDLRIVGRCYLLIRVM